MTELVEIISRDRELAAALRPEQAAVAAVACRARLERVGKGSWDPRPHHPAPDGFGLLVMSGFLVRRVGCDGRCAAELLGPGDLLRPWQAVSSFASEPSEPSWQVIAAAELAVLDEAFARRSARFHGLALQLTDRAMLRSRHLAMELAAVQQPRVDRRLHLLLWQLADRWGRTTADGVRVEVPLTHALLAELVAARRPSVTTALGALAGEGRVERRGAAWFLRGGPPAEAAGAARGPARPED